LVEVGSGSGIATRCFPHLPGNRLAAGVDVERGSLRKAAETSDRVDYLAATADAGLPFRTGSVDSVVASEVFEHLTHPGGFIEEVWRILKPGGRLVLTTPNTESIVLMLLRLL
ncbi:MAG: class I SAM-dependent methyltransferase, partial [Methanobacteriota archaeon]